MRLLKKGYLKVSPIHRLYYELRGKRDGIPAVFLHGGPGSRFKPRHFKSFPANHCVLFFDQRGCGQSKPPGELRENTTQHLVEDIAKLMDHIGFKKAKIVGGSWGSTLALCFAIKHPDRVRKLVIGGVYLGTREENLRMIEHFRLFAPGLYERYRKPSHYGKLTSQAVRQLHALEGALAVNTTTWEKAKLEKLKRSHWIEPHYLRHDCFLAPDHIMKNLRKISHIPIVIIQGQQDFVCPPIAAWEVSKKFRKKRFVLVPGGHLIPTTGDLYRKHV